MSNSSLLVYDCEIINLVPTQNEEPMPGVNYCDGWDDFDGMGISVITAFDYVTNNYRIFCNDNFEQFQALVNQRDVIAGFNSLAFDNNLCRANGIEIDDAKSYDLLVEIWDAVGLGRAFTSADHKGFGIDACSLANFGEGKTSDSAMAPVWWQRGEIGNAIDHGLRDTRMTKRLLDTVMHNGLICHPKEPVMIDVRKPPVQPPAIRFL